MKKLIQILAVLSSATQLFAFTPHINKGRIEEISVARATRELQLTEKELKDINKEFFGVLQSNNFPPVMEADFDSPAQIFRQTFSETNEVLYRVISQVKEPEPFARGGIFQKGYYANGKGKPNLIFADFYDAEGEVFGQSVTSVQYNYNFMPVIKDNKIAGIMIYGIERFDKRKSIVAYAGNEEILYHKAAVYWSDDFSTADLRNTYSNEEDMHIECSKPLVDENDVFRYTIQNAFDKNPATSYVEDTEDDLMYVSLGLSYKTVNGKTERIENKKIAIINGYAQNNDLYLKNNRVKEISGNTYSNGELLFEDDDTLFLADSTLKYQIFDWTPSQSFSVQKIYRGSKYSDTCIAELDFFNEKMKWIFGGLN